jgi:V/A-type H+-transporting ATPase subunit C
MSAARYAYLHARVSMLAGQLLGMERLQALIDADDAADTWWRKLDTHASMQTDDAIDQGVVTILLKELAVLARPLSGPPRELLAYWAHRFELGNLKTVIRGKMSGQPLATIEAQLLDMGPFTSLPLADLLHSDTPAELLRRLERSAYADIAHQTRGLLELGESSFALDAALDRHYFAGLARHAAAVQDSGAHLLRAIVGSVIDRVNLVWLLRYRYAYNLPPAQAYYLLIPAGHRLSAQQLLQLAQYASHDEVIEHLPPPYGALLAGARDTEEVTLVLERETWRVAANALNHSAFNVARALAYLILRERDMRRMRAIVRGHRLGLEGALIRAAIGMDRPRGDGAVPAH